MADLNSNSSSANCVWDFVFLDLYRFRNRGAEQDLSNILQRRAGHRVVNNMGMYCSILLELFHRAYLLYTSPR